MSHPTVLGKGFPREPGNESFKIGARLGSNAISIPNMFNMSGYRSVLLQQVPIKTVNEIAYPPFRVSGNPTNIDMGYNSVIFGHNDKVSKKDRQFHERRFRLNNPILRPAPTYLL